MLRPTLLRLTEAGLVALVLCAALPARAQDGGVSPLPAQDAGIPPLPAALVVADADVAAMAVPIEDPTGHALDAFYDALARTARGDGVTHVLHFGDSNIAFDGVTSTLRSDFQTRFGDAGHGFVLLAHAPLPYGHRGVDVRTSGRWRIEPIVHARVRDGTYGLGGVLQLPAAGATASFTTSPARLGGVGQSASRLLLFYRAHPHGGVVELTARDEGDHGWTVPVDTAADPPRDDVGSLAVPDGPHLFVVRHADGREVRIYGVAMERDVPGVVWDSLGMVGVRARRILALDPEHARAVVAQRTPQLLVIAFGANEASDGWPGDAVFDATFRDVVARLRAGAPDAACLVMAPTDQAPPGARARTFPSLPRIVEGERRVAHTTGCAFFDTLAAMGGPGSVTRWSRQRLAVPDHRHLTPPGYAKIAAMLEAALYAGLRERVRALGTPLAPALGTPLAPVQHFTTPHPPFVVPR